MIDKTMIKLVLADDQTLVRGALAALLSMENDLEIVGTCGRGDEVFALVQATHADVCLLDIEMPGIDGITVAAELRDQASWCRVLIVTTFGRPGYLRRAMDAGVAGFLVKDTPAEDLAPSGARGPCRRSSYRPSFGRRIPHRGTQSLVGAGTGDSAAGRVGGLHLPHRLPALSVGGHGAQPRVLGHRQDGCCESHRGCRHGSTAGVVVRRFVIAAAGVAQRW